MHNNLIQVQEESGLLNKYDFFKLKINNVVNNSNINGVYYIKLGTYYILWESGIRKGLNLLESEKQL